jgi:acyl homoserine lactone synthase
LIAKYPCKHLPEQYFIIEQLSQRIFGCLLICWTEFEIFRTIQNSNQICNNKKQQQTYPSAQVINEHYHYEIVADTALDTRLFHTEFCEQPLLLSDAIVLINIATFIKEHKWYEMLKILNISSKGEHFILYQFDEENDYPKIISSALIEPYHQKKNWLFFDNFFQSNKWNKVESSEAIAQYFPDFSSQKNQPCDYFNTLSCSELENAMFSSIVDKTRMCGVIRFTVNGPKMKLNYHMYLAQKGLANALFLSGRDMIFSIIEQPAMILFYQEMNCVEKEHMPFVFTGSQDINNSGLVTYKGICLTKNARYVFNQYNFKEYNVKIIQRRKLLK